MHTVHASLLVQYALGGKILQYAQGKMTILQGYSGGWSAAKPLVAPRLERDCEGNSDGVLAIGLVRCSVRVDRFSSGSSKKAPSESGVRVLQESEVSK
jgi:hypothetical protein